MNRSLNILIVYASFFFSTLAFADSNNNDNNAGTINDGTLAQSQSNPKINYNNEARRNPVSTAFAVAPLPSATCRSGAALGVQGMGFGITGGGDKAVVSCEINEATRIAATVLGDQVTALYIFCQNEFAKVAPACKAIAKPDTNNREMAGNHSVNMNPLTN